MDPALRKATLDDLPVIKNLATYYVYDMSEGMGWDPNPDGRYEGCSDLPVFWEKPDHHAYVITVGNRIAGFAMVRPYPLEPTRTEIGEFFVLRKFRYRGVGAAIAFRLFDSFPGPWLVRALDGNVNAQNFLEKAIASYTDGRFTHDSENYVCPHSGPWPMQFYRFESRNQKVLPPGEPLASAL